MKIDHITFVAQSLDQAQAYAMQTFGVPLPAGGKHPLMGTHNLLTRIAPGVFLEFIAIDPQAPAPPHPRWFALDRLARTGALRESPKLYGWVASRPGLDAFATSILPQKIHALSRGDLRWNFSLRDDGEAEDGGATPHFIEWEDGVGPAKRMTDVGIRFGGLTIRHPQAATLKSRLTDMGWDLSDPVNSALSWLPAPACSLTAALETRTRTILISGGTL